MDPLQQKALNALEQYTLLSKSATSPRAAVDLVVQATSAANTYVFAELLETPNIQSLRTAAPEYAPYLTLLEIFSWGTWSDYTSTPSLPELSERQSLKLRQLSLLSLSGSHATLTYQYLLSALDLPSTRALEDLVISSIYAGLITAKLDTQAKRVDVSSVSPLRDLKPNGVPQLVSILAEWTGRCDGVLAGIEGQVTEIRARAAERRKVERDHEAKVEKALGHDVMTDRGLKVAGKRGAGDAASGGGLDLDQAELMEIDENSGRAGPRNAKRGGRFGGALTGFGKRLGN